MNRSDAIRELQTCAGPIRARGATALYVFGSTARDEARPDSDLDILLDYDRDSRFSLVDLARIKTLIEDRLGVTVDIATRDSLHPALRGTIEASALRVF